MTHPWNAVNAHAMFDLCRESESASLFWQPDTLDESKMLLLESPFVIICVASDDLQRP